MLYVSQVKTEENAFPESSYPKENTPLTVTQGLSPPPNTVKQSPNGINYTNHEATT